ncbi:RidA family protein [Clostridium sediminicola]|uniref:RidA family protein n=1 Tax=Clostridium sediminicola TaxID=3114879 RepID=UPI0031F1DE16
MFFTIIKNKEVEFIKRKFDSNKGFVPSGTIAQVSIGNNIAHVSGQISINPETGEIEKGTVSHQTKRVLENIKGIVTDMGLSMDDIIKCNVFISSMKCFDEMNEVYQKYFSIENPPARQTVGAEIWGGLDVEISAEVLID